MAKRLTQEEFINLAQLAHGDLYDYSLVKYVNFRTPVIVICKKCGPFSVKPHLHTSNKTTCPSCSIKSKTGTLDKFIAQCQSKFDCSDLDFSNTVYKGCKHPISVRCIKHGVFTKHRAHDMLSSKGCPTCAMSGNGQYKWGCINQDDQTPMEVYLIKFQCRATKEQFYKIGITKHNAELRFRGYTNFDKIVLLTKTAPLNQAVQIEEWASRMLTPTTYEFAEKFNGRTECYSLTPVELISCIRHIQTVLGEPQLSFC